MILDDHKNDVGQPKPFGNRRKNNTGNTNENQFQTPRKLSKMKIADSNQDFSSPNRFQISQDNINENNHDLNENDPITNENDHDLNENDLIYNNSASSKDKEKTMSNRNTKKKFPATVTLGDSILKNVYGNTISKATKFKKHIVVKHFSGAKLDDIKHYMKPTQKNILGQTVWLPAKTSIK